MEARDSFKSRLGFILVSAGCAIGIGNVWRFPYVTGEYGGAVFVLFYLLFLVILGIPVVTMELAVGRASRKSVKEGFMKLEPPGTWWHLHGWIALAGSFVLMIYYTTISGWMVDYFVRFLDGSFQGLRRKRSQMSSAVCWPILQSSWASWDSMSSSALRSARAASPRALRK